MKYGNIKDLIFELFKPYKKNIVVVSLMMVLISTASFFQPWLSKMLIDEGILKNDIKNTLYYVSLMLLIFIIQQLVGWVQFIFYKEISIKIPYDLNRRASQHILAIRVKYFKERNFTAVIGELYQDIANISSLTNTEFLTSFISLFKILAGIIALFIINWQLTLVMLITVPIKILVSSYFFKKQERIHRILMEVQSKFSSWLGDGISGITEVKLYGVTKSMLKSLDEILGRGNKSKSKIMNYGYLDSVISSTLAIMFTSVLYIIGAYMISINQMSLGSLIAFITYSSFVFEPITIISYLLTQFSSIKPALERFDKFMKIESEIDTSHSEVIHPEFDFGDIQLNNVTLKYQNETALDNVSFRINKGERVAIIGSNGSGKSSLINLLLRFYEPISGEILLNGSNINTYTFSSYRTLWSVMTQDFYLFNDSIYNNINITKSTNEEIINDSCKKSGVYDFSSSLPDKLDHIIGYNGSQLSGGERQKVGLARTIAKKSRLLVLDEATLSFDSISEQLFNDEILSFDYDSIILITHRLEILQKMDKIIHLEDGKIEGIGSYDELHSKSDKFKEMIKTIHQEERKDAV